MPDLLTLLREHSHQMDAAIYIAKSLRGDVLRKKVVPEIIGLLVDSAPMLAKLHHALHDELFDENSTADPDEAGDQLLHACLSSRRAMRPLLVLAAFERRHGVEPPWADALREAYRRVNYIFDDCRLGWPYVTRKQLDVGIAEAERGEFVEDVEERVDALPGKTDS